jgi:hypothetical protein
MSGVDPGRLTAEERLAEIAEILAAGLLRLQARQAEHAGPARSVECGLKSTQLSAHHGESSLHFSPIESGHPTRYERENRG